MAFIIGICVVILLLLDLWVALQSQLMTRKIGATILTISAAIFISFMFFGDSSLRIYRLALVPGFLALVGITGYVHGGGPGISRIVEVLVIYVVSGVVWLSLLWFFIASSIGLANKLRRVISRQR
jgi:hypothetical protein